LQQKKNIPPFSANYMDPTLYGKQLISNIYLRLKNEQETIEFPAHRLFLTVVPDLSEN